MNLERLQVTVAEAAGAMAAVRVGSLPDNPSHGVVIGLYLRGARLLTALLRLSETDMEDCGEGITRSIMEHSASAGWLLLHPKRLDELTGAFARGWRILRDEGSDMYAALSEEELEMIAIPEATLPDMPQRLRACGLEMLYTIYRGLSEKAHGTLVAAAAGLRSSFSPGTYLAVASHVACHVGAQVSETFGWGIEGYLRELKERVKEATVEGE